MSFSQEVKEELATHISSAMHCKIAETAAILSMCGSVAIDENGKYSVRFRTETKVTADKLKQLLWKTFRIETEIVSRNNAYSKSQKTYTITIKEHDEALKVLQATKLINSYGDIEENLSITNNVIIMKNAIPRWR